MVLFFQIVFRPIFLTKSMHTDFVVKEKCTVLVFKLNRDMRVVFKFECARFSKK